MTAPAVSPRALWRIALAVGARPRLWPAAVVQTGRLAAPGWWRRWPPVPWPDPEWMRFRLRTAYGDDGHEPEPEDVVAWLDWCRQTDRLRYPRQR